MAEHPKILVVEDEKNLALTLVERLRKEGFDVVWAKNAEEAALEISHRKFDLALLDVGLPDGSGFEVGKALKKAHPSTAMIFLTAFGSPEDRVRGLELGAEDYVVKPFHLKELLLRIQNGLKRAKVVEQTEKDLVVVGRARICFSKLEAQVGEEVHTLTQREAALLKILIERRGRVVSRDEILNHAWPEDEFPTSRTIDNFVLRLRKIIETQPEQPQVIRSHRGVGYQLV